MPHPSRLYFFSFFTQDKPPNYNYNQYTFYELSINPLYLSLLTIYIGAILFQVSLFCVLFSICPKMKSAIIANKVAGIAPAYICTSDCRLIPDTMIRPKPSAPI